MNDVALRVLATAVSRHITHAAARIPRIIFVRYQPVAAAEYLIVGLLCAQLPTR